jgi:KDO2-lipid IV(A) lauroyltransferase
VLFFGERARMPAGPASLALQTGAVLLPVTLAFSRDGWLCTFHEPVPHSDVATMTQAVADAFAVGIAAHPADWHMLQRLWLDDLAADDPRRASA